MAKKIDKTQKISKDEIGLKTIPSKCCHCGDVYQLAKWKVTEGKKTGVSHGLCRKCYDKEIKKIDNSS